MCIYTLIPETLIGEVCVYIYTHTFQKNIIGEVCVYMYAQFSYSISLKCVYIHTSPVFVSEIFLYIYNMYMYIYAYMYVLCTLD